VDVCDCRLFDGVAALWEETQGSQLRASSTTRSSGPDECWSTVNHIGTKMAVESGFKSLQSLDLSPRYLNRKRYLNLLSDFQWVRKDSNVNGLEDT
jgi:hypothetical protein